MSLQDKKLKGSFEPFSDIQAGNGMAGFMQSQRKARPFAAIRGRCGDNSSPAQTRRSPQAAQFSDTDLRS